ncbi:hypothetical protein BD414DRAFT_182873 [Trametes punicea]|nr:hypothetical protein BD414DRAFT_182873 [Trametes punicea]
MWIKSRLKWQSSAFYAQDAGSRVGPRRSQWHGVSRRGWPASETFTQHKDPRSHY